MFNTYMHLLVPDCGRSKFPQSASPKSPHALNITNSLKANHQISRLRIATPTQYTALTRGTLLAHEAHLEPSLRGRNLHSAPAYNFIYLQVGMVGEIDILAQAYEPMVYAQMTPMERFESASPSTFMYHQHQAYIPLKLPTNTTTWHAAPESPYNGISHTLEYQNSSLQTEAGSRDDFRLAQVVAGCFVDGFYTTMRGTDFGCYDLDFVGIGAQFEKRLN